MMLSKIFGFFGTKEQKGEKFGVNPNYQTTQLPNHQTSTYGRMPMDAANGLTVKRSNGPTGLRGRRFAAPWARAAAVAAVAGGMWLGLLGGGVSSAWGETVSFGPSDFSGQGTADTGSSMSVTKDGITVSTDKGYGTTQIRVYKNGTLTVSAVGGKTITSITFSYSGSYWGFAADGLEGTTWSGSSSSVLFDSSSKQTRLTAISITYSGGGPTVPTVGSPTCPAANVTAGGATLGGTVTANGGETVTKVGVQYSTDGGSTWTTVERSGAVPAVNTAFTVDVSGLTGGLTYTYRAYAVNSVGTGYSGTGTFTTTCPTWGSITPSIDGSGKTSAVFSWNKVPGAAGYQLQVWQTVGGGGGSTVTDTLDSSLTGVTGTSYTAWEDKSDASDAVWAGKSAKHSSYGEIQLNKNSGYGIWTTGSGGNVQKVKVTWNSGTTSGRTLKVYGDTSAFSGDSGGTELGEIQYGTSTELTVSGSYQYVRLDASDGAMYFDKIEVTWAVSGGSTTYYYGTSAGGASAGTWNSGNNKWEQTVSGLTAGKTYNYKLEVTGGGTCAAAPLTSTFDTDPDTSGSIGVRPETVGNLGTYAKGAKLGVFWANAIFDRGGWDGGAQVGIGKAGQENSWTSWYTLDYYAPDGENGEKNVHANLQNFQFTQTGQYNLIYQARTSTSVDWVSQSGTPTGGRFGYATAYPPSDIGATYFTVVDVPDPTGCSAVGASGGVELSWSRATTTHDSSAKYNVMVVRYAKGGTETPPTDGTPYSANATIGDGKVVYASWSGDGFKDESAVACTDYDYYIYSENYNYYSDGVKVEGKYCAPSFGSSDSVSRSTTVGTAITEVTVPDAGGTPAATYSISPTGVSGASFNASTRKFTFTPTAAGTFTFTVTASNAAGADDYTITVVVTPKPPTGGTPTYPSNQSEGRVTVPWTKNTAGNDVMVVRVANNGTAPAPANGTAYPTGSGLGGQILYKGNATSYADSGLTAGTDYDYYLFSVSGNYYSTGVKVDATASKAPRFASSSVSKSTTVGTAASNTQTASGTPSSMTYSVTCTEGGATSGFSVDGSGVFSFTPTAAGTFKFSVSAANGVTAVSASSYTITVTVSAGTPVITKKAETGVSASGATVNAQVDAKGGATTVTFKYGTEEETYNLNPTSLSGGDVGASATAADVSATLSGLIAGTTYYYKWTASRNNTAVATAEGEFTTDCFASGPVVTVNPPSGTAQSQRADFSWPLMAGASHYLVSMWTGGTGYALVTSAPANWSGDYVIVAETAAQAMNNTCSGNGSGYMGLTGVTISDNKIATAAAALVWTLDGNNTDGYTLYNAAAEKYLYPATGTSMTWSSEKPSARWSVSIDENNVVRLQYKGQSYYLQYNGSASRFTCYQLSSNQKDLRLFKTDSAPATGSVNGGGSAAITDVEIAQPGAGTGTVSVSVTGLAANEDPGYNWSVTAVGGGTCSSKAEGSGLVVNDTPVPVITVSPASWDFGAVRAGGSATKVIAVGNEGTALLTVSGITFSGGASSKFSVSSSSFTVAAGSSQNVTVTYTPGTVGTYSETMSIASDDAGSPTTVALTGTVPTITVKEGSTTLTSGSSTVAYGNCRYTSPVVPVTKTITVENHGTGPLTLTAPTLAAADQGFTIEPALSGTTVAANGSVTFGVTFTPQAGWEGGAAKSTTVSLGNDGLASAFTFTVTATVPKPALNALADKTGLTGMTASIGVPGVGPGSFTVSGSYLRGDVTVTAPSTEFQVALSVSGPWGATATIPEPADGMLAATTVYVRLSGNSAGTHSGSVTVTTTPNLSRSTTVSGTVSSEVAGDVWIRPRTYGALGTWAVGDTLGEYWLNLEIGQTTWHDAQVGFGTSANGTGFTWYTLYGYEGNDQDVKDSWNRRAQANVEGYQFTAAGQYNVIYQAKGTSSATDWVSKSGGTGADDGFGHFMTYPPNDFRATYFTVADVADPTLCTATASGTGINLSWTKAATAHDSSARYNVMVVRYAGNAASPARPVDGTTTYALDDTIGTGANAGTVVYAPGGGTSQTDSGVALGGSYKYVFYSENYGYFSAGVTVSATANGLSAPTVGVSTAGAGTLTGVDGYGETYVVARNTSGTFTDPAAGTSLPSLDGNFCGGTVVYVDDDDEFTDSSAVGCTAYYYKAWEYLGGTWSSGSTVAGPVTMDEPGTPTVTGTSSTDNSITINFGSVARADGYKLSVWTAGSGGAAGTYTRVTSLDDLTDGKYVFIAVTNSSSYYFAMSNAVADNKFIHSIPFEASAFGDGGNTLQLGEDDTEIVWDLEYDSATSSWSIKNGSHFVKGTRSTSSNQAEFGTDGSVDEARWVLSYNSERAGWEIVNQLVLANTRTHLRFNYNGGNTPRYCCYASGQSFPMLYKRTSGGKAYVSGYDENGGSVSPTSATVGGLAQGTTYNYSLWAIGNSTSCAGTPATGSVMTTGTAAPGAPTVSAVANGAAGMTVTVRAGSPAASGYLVYRFATEAEATAATTVSQAASTGTQVGGGAVSAGTVEDTGLLGCTRYWYRAWGRNGTGGSAVDSPASSVASAETATVGAPSGLDETGVGAHGATLAWTGTAGASGYDVSVWHYGMGWGDPKTVTYTNHSVSTVKTNGTAPTGSHASFSATGEGTYYYMEAGDTMTLTLTGWDGCRITGISLRTCADTNDLGVASGGGSFAMSVGGRTISSIADAQYCDPGWHGAWEMVYWQWVNPAVTPTVVGAGETVTVQLTCSESWLWYDQCTITYQEPVSGGRVYDWENGTGVGGVSVSVSGTSATVTGLEPGTSYGWSVAATAGCTGDAVADSDGFTTDELVSIPVISALTPGVGSLGGTVTATDAEGATLVLKRYEDPSAADAATGAGSLGGVIVETTGADGSWSFSETGLDGCKAYYYRAWLKKTVDGVEEWSKGSVVAGARTELGTPVVTALGAGTTILLSWAEVKGATSYDVTVSSSSAFTPGAATTRVSEDFDAKNPSGWTFSGTAWYGSEGANNSGYIYGGSGFSVKFDDSGDTATTPAFTAGATSLSFWMKATSSGSSLTIEALESGSWNTVRTLSAGTTGGGETVDLSGHPTATQLRFTGTKDGGNIALDHVTVTGPGSGGTIVFTSTVTAEPYSATVPGLEQGHTYYYRVTAHGSGECDDKTAEGQATPENAALIMVSPKHYNFGTVNKNEGGKTATFTVRNTGNRDLEFTGVSLVQDGTAYSITQPASAVDQKAAIPAGGERTYTVLFNPTNSGLRAATLQFLCNAANADAVEGQTYKKVEIPLEGTCYDPATADPTVYWLKVEDELGIEDTVTDHSMAHENDEPVLTVLTWHYNRSYRTLDRSAKATQWTLYDPNGDVVVTSGGTRLENQFFTDVEDYVYDGKTCAKFSAPIPALGTGKAVRGTYTVKVKVWDSTGTYCTETKQFLPIERGWLFEDFTRADREATGSGALENGWTAMVSGGAVAGEAAIHADALELYGANGECPKQAGRIAVARDMSDVGYATNPHDFVGTGSWGFHFKTGAKTVGFGDGSTAGAFVLGSTKSTWLTSDNGQIGYAVAMMEDAVRLVKFEKSLLAGGTITQLGEAQYSGTQGKLLAVRVDFLPGQDEVDADESDDGVAHAAVPAKFQLYVKEVAATGGSPIAECTDADMVLEYSFPVAEDHDLKFAGMMWNHGTAQVSDKTGAMFDDIYMPHMEGQTEPMMFHVIDEDTEAPAFHDFSILGAYAAQSIWDNGLVVTGYVHDVSGIASGSVTYTVYDGDEVLAGPEPMSVTAVEGESTEFKLVGTISSGVIPSSIRSTACRFVVTATDGDDDRSEGGANIDSLTGSGSFPFTLCDTAPTAPAWATAEVDGAEMVILRWARTAGAQYVVVRSDEEIGDNASPQGRTETMAEGTRVDGWGTVVYNGTGDNHLKGDWTAREFVVAPGSANYFAVYGMTGNAETGYYFSAPTKPSDWSWTTGSGMEAETTYATAACGEGAGLVPAGSPNGMPCTPSVTVRSNSWPVVTATYEPGEGVDAFAYRTSVSYPTNNIAETPADLALEYGFETRTGTGSGWETNAPTGWQGDTNAWKIHDGSLLVGKTGYPTPTANKLYWQDKSRESLTKTDMKLTRWLDAPESGDFFVAAILNFQYDGTGKWVTLSMVDEDGNDLVSFGKQGGDTDLSAAIMTPSTSPFGDNTRTSTNNGAAYTLTTGHGNDHIVIGQLSRTENKLRMWCYTGNLKIPEVFSKKTAAGAEVALTVATTAVNTVRADWTFDPSLSVPDVAGIRLCAGSDGGVELGHVYFDEVRFAGTWEELLLFNDPEVEDYDLGRPTGSGMSNGTNSLGQTQWLVSDGALAHGNVGLNATFDLYHRTGIDAASFHILSSGESMTNLLRVVSGLATAAEGGTAANVTLTGTKGAVYGEWATPAGGAKDVAMPTNWISLESNYVVEVSLRSSGGREATATSATDNMGGGATDLFFGEYGEGASWDKYVEVYNGTGRDIDLHNYYIVRPQNEFTNNNHVSYRCNDFSTGYTNLILHDTGPYGRLSQTPFILHHKQTVVLLNDVKQPGHPDRLAAMKSALDTVHAKYLVMPTNVLDSGGKVPYLLVKAEDFDETAVSNAWKKGQRVTLNWLDACGCSTNVKMDGVSVTERYIMSRKATAKHLPRSNPNIIDPEEWDYRRWSFPKSGTGAVDDISTTPPYTNFIATAGGYDRTIGLGGTMEFKVYDDDTDAPVLRGGGVSVGGTRRAAEPGERVYVMGAWSFTNWPAGVDSPADLTEAQYGEIAAMWPMGMTTSGGISWSPLLGESLGDVLETTKTANSGQSGVDFDGLVQVKRGNLLAKANRDRFSNEKEVWLGFDLDVSKLSDAVLTFGYAGGPNGFQNGRVEVSTTGLEDSFKMPNEWDFAPQSGTNATTWAEWSRDLADAVAAVPEVTTAGHLWFRVVLKNYKSSGGTFRMDNIRLEGAPEAVRVSDAELNTQTVAFDAKVLDAASGLDADTATFEYGVAEVALTPSRSLVDGGKSESTFTWSKTEGFEKAKVQDWYTQSQDGKTQLRVTISDKDDDRAGDALEMTSSYGLLDVYDDDAEPPMLEMETMKPRKEGVFAEWKPKEKTQTPSETMDGLDVSALELNTTAGRTSKPRYAGIGEGDAKTYALFANGWQLGSKYWTTTISNSLAGAGAISKISFQSKVGNVLAPTGFRVEYGTVSHGATAAETTASAGTGSLLTTGDAWSKENDAEAGGSPIKTWKAYELEFATPIPLAKAGDEGDMIELRIFGTGADPDGIGAYWYLYDLKLEGEITLAEDGYTYVTDDSLAGGTTLDLRGSVYDEVSGLLAAPSFALTNVANSQVVSSGTISFSEEKALSARKTKDDGAFSQEIAVGALGYGVQLAEYKGGIHAEDADDDRGTAGEDKLSLDAQFAFTVIDQDLVGPTAPTNVKVNGVDVPETAPTRDNVTWTNKPEFLVAFDVAHDTVPTEAELANADWLSAHGVEAASVKKASLQTGAAGIGEYRVALATDATSLSNAPAYSVAVTNGALANYGFERYADTSWANPDSESGINKGDKVGGTYPVAEGTNSYYLRAYTSGNNNPAASQIIPFAVSASDQTLTVDLSLKIFKRAVASKIYAKFEFSEDEETWMSALSTDVQLNNDEAKETWFSKTMDTQTLTASDGAKYLRFSLYSDGGTANIDDVRLSVRVGSAPAEGTADRATMRYVADAAAQGLNVKYLFAADADNNRKQDRMTGATAPFYTAYDITAPTPVAFKSHGKGASTDQVDDPTTQFDLTWFSNDIGPDNPDDDNYQSSWTGKEVLSPWGTYRVYYRTYDPMDMEDKASKAGKSTETYLYETLIEGTDDQGCPKYHGAEWKHVENGAEIEDETAPALGGKRKYSGWDTITKDANNQQTVRLYDLDFDQEYVVVVVGVDKAGNEGPVTANSWATNNTIKFAITQGVMRAEADIPEEWRSGLNGADRAAALYWTASSSGGAVTRDYDLLYWDARSFREDKFNDWTNVAGKSVKANWFVDAGALTHEASQIRFYRAAYKDRWRRTLEVGTTGRREVVEQRPLMSEDVYAMTAVPLVQGQNYVTLHGFGVGNGETNTLGAIFGTDPNIWPIGFTSDKSVKLEVFKVGFTKDDDESQRVDHIYYLGPTKTEIIEKNGAVVTNILSADWYRIGSTNQIYTHYVDEDIFRHGVSINIPPTSGTTNSWGTTNAGYWHPVLLVPTNTVYCKSVIKDKAGNDVSNETVTVDFSVPIRAGNPRTGVEWNFCSFTLPVAFHPSELGLENCGFVPSSGTHLTQDCDILYAYDSVTKSLRHGSGMFLGHANATNTDLVWRSILGNNPEIHGKPFYPNDVLVINSRSHANATDEGEGKWTWTWTYHPTNYYDPPTRWGGW